MIANRETAGIQYMLHVDDTLWSAKLANAWRVIIYGNAIAKNLRTRVVLRIHRFNHHWRHAYSRGSNTITVYSSVVHAVHTLRKGFQVQVLFEVVCFFCAIRSRARQCPLVLFAVTVEPVLQLSGLASTHHHGCHAYGSTTQSVLADCAIVDAVHTC